MAQAIEEGKENMFMLSPKSSTFIRELREKQPISRNSLTYAESQALREHKDKENLKRAGHIKDWHKAKIEPLYEVSKKHASSNKDDFIYDVLQLVHRYTKKRHDRLSELNEERYKRLKALSAEEQDDYGHYIMAINERDIQFQVKETEIKSFLIGGLEPTLRKELE